MAGKRVKTEFMQREGYALYSDTGHRMLDHLAALTPRRLSAKESRTSNFVSLFHICEQLESEARGTVTSYPERINFTEPDKMTVEAATQKGADIFGRGIADLNFAFHFIPVLMKDMLVATKDRLGIAQDELDAFSMTDFASIMREQWFQDMLTDTAKTKNGLWGRIGMDEKEYDLERQTIKQKFPPIVEHIYDATLETIDELEVARIGLGNAAKKHLTDHLRGKDTVGCPVAAHSRIVDPSDPHVQSLVDQGRLEITPRGNGTYRGTQEKTPIERSALVVADFLDEYVDRYGEPSLKLA